MTWNHPALAQRALDEGDQEIKRLRARIEQLEAERNQYLVSTVEYGNQSERLRAVVVDMLAGLQYLRDNKTVPYGFGIDRLEETGRAALAISSVRDDSKP